MTTPSYSSPVSGGISPGASLPPSATETWSLTIAGRTSEAHLDRPVNEATRRIGESPFEAKFAASLEECRSFFDERDKAVTIRNAIVHPRDQAFELIDARAYRARFLTIVHATMRISAGPHPAPNGRSNKAAAIRRENEWKDQSQLTSRAGLARSSRPTST